MSTGVRTILGIAEIIVGSYVPGAQFLVSMGVATLIGVAVEEITPSPHTATTGAAPIKTTWAATNSYGSLIYGIGRAGGVLCYLNTTDSDGVNDIRGNPIAHPAKRAILDIFVTHSVTDPATGCAGFGSIYVNEIEIPTDAITYTVGTKEADGFVTPVGGKVQGQVTAGPFAGMLEIRQYDGTQTTAVDILPQAYGSEPDIPVDDNFIPYGLTGTHYRFYPSSDMAAFKKAFGGALPHNVMAVIKGEKLYDPRASGQSATDKSTWTWSENSALAAYDFLTRAALNGGCGFPRTIVDETSVTASANACDTVVPYGPAGGTWAADTAYTIYQHIIDPAGNVQVAYTAGTSGDTEPVWGASVGAITNDGTVVWHCTALAANSGPLYRCDGVIDLSKTREQALMDILGSMAGNVSQSSNGFPLGILSGSWSAPAGEIDESFLAGAVQIQDAPQDQRYNVVKAHYTDKDQAFNDVVAPAVPDFASADYAAWVAADGYEIDKDLDLPLVNNHDNAQLVAEVKARQSRYLQSVSMVCNFRALVYNVGDRVQVTNAERNWSFVNILVTKMTLQPDFTIKVEGTRDEATCYESTVPTPGGYIVPPDHQYTAPPTPSGLTAAGNSGGVLLQWTAIPAALAETIEIWRSDAADGSYLQIDSVNGAKASYVDPLANGATGYYQLRAFNGRLYSDFTGTVSAASQLGADNATDGAVIGGNLKDGDGNVAGGDDVLNSHAGATVINPRFEGTAPFVSTYGWNFDAAPGAVADGEFYAERGANSPYAPIPTYLVHQGQAGETNAHAANQRHNPVEPGQVVAAQVALHVAGGVNAGAYARATINWLDSAGNGLSQDASDITIGTRSGDLGTGNSKLVKPAPANAGGYYVGIQYVGHTAGYITATAAVSSIQPDHLGQVPDDPTGDRYAATANEKTGGGRGYAAIDASNVVVAGSIDFSRGYTNKTQDYIGDGGIYGRTLLSRLNAGRPFIDFSESFHLNKTADYIGATAARTFMHPSYVDSSLRPVTLRRSASDIGASDISLHSEILNHIGGLNNPLADWGTQIGSRPVELTDGRIAAGLDASGDLNRDIAQSRADSSNLLRRSGGGLFAGALNADRTADNPQGSTWLTDSTQLARGGDSVTRFVDRIAANMEYGAAGSGISLESLKPGEAGAVKSWSNVYDDTGEKAATVDGGARARLGLGIDGLILAGIHPFERMTNRMMGNVADDPASGRYGAVHDAATQNDTRTKALTISFGENEAPNPGFEGNSVGTPLDQHVGGVGTPVGDGWHVGVIDEQIWQIWLTQRSTSASHAGGLSLMHRIDSTNSINGSQAYARCRTNIITNVPVKPGERRRIGGWVRSNIGAIPTGIDFIMRIGGHWLFDDGTSTDFFFDYVPTVNTDSGWLALDGIVEVPDNCGLADIYCDTFIENINTGAYGFPDTFANLQFDDVEFRKATVEDAGSGVRVGDGLNLLALNTGGYATSYWTGSAITVGSTSIGASAGTWHAGGRSVAYNSWSVGGLANSTTYYFALIDPDYAGGTPNVIYSTQPQNVINQDGAIFVFKATTKDSGGGGGGGSFGCVALTMWLRPGLRAARAHEHTVIDCADAFATVGARRVLGMQYCTEPCVRLLADNGAALVCSHSTPFTLPDGTSKNAPDMQGEQVLTDGGIATIWRVIDLGALPVARISVGGLSYAAGEDPANRIYSHNTAKP